MDNDTRVALLALKAILEHEQSYRGTVLYDHNVFTFAKVALEKTGYINRDVPAVETSLAPARVVPRCEGEHEMTADHEFGDGALHCARCGIAEYQL